MIYLVDASVYVFRAYYSMPPEMVDRDGHPAHATFGFARFLGDLIERAKPHYMAVAFDESLSTSFRNQIFPAYKANRDPPPADLKLQFERCQEFCRHAGIPAFSHSEYEADDIVGTLATRFRLHRRGPEHAFDRRYAGRGVTQLASLREGCVEHHPVGIGHVGAWLRLALRRRCRLGGAG